MFTVQTHNHTFTPTKSSYKGLQYTGTGTEMWLLLDTSRGGVNFAGSDHPYAWSLPSSFLTWARTCLYCSRRSFSRSFFTFSEVLLIVLGKIKHTVSILTKLLKYARKKKKWKKTILMNKRILSLFHTIHLVCISRLNSDACYHVWVVFSFITRWEFWNIYVGLTSFTTFSISLHWDYVLKWIKYILTLLFISNEFLIFLTGSRQFWQIQTK